jgi:hypothetical protein
MNVRKSLVTAAAVLGMSLGGQAMAQAVDCNTGIHSIRDWAAAGSCTQGDKIWTYTSSNLDATVQILFQGGGGGNPLLHAMQIIGFDESAAAGAWNIKYSIAVANPLLFYISGMAAGADNPGGGSNLTKDVTGDPNFNPFQLTVVNGVENAGSIIAGLTASALNVDESFSVNAGSTLLSVSNTYAEKERLLPTPGTLVLLGMGLGALGLSRRNRKIG